MSNQIFRKQPVYQAPTRGIVPFRAVCKRHRSFDDHWHNEIEIFYVMPNGGSITVYIEGKPYLLCERDFLVVPSVAVHRIEAPEQNKVLRFDIGAPLLGENFRPFMERRFNEPFHSFSKSTGSPLDAAEPILHAISREKFALREEEQPNHDLELVSSRMRVSAYLFQLAAILLETLPATALSDSDAKKRYAHRTVQSIIFYIHNHYNEPITLTSAALMAGYEKTHFCQLFKEITGMTFHQYITKRRLEEALPLLRDTSLPIASIAQSVGIANSKTFSRLIRRQYAMTPKELRAKSQSNEQQKVGMELP